jgi:hypothetical protein
MRMENQEIVKGNREESILCLQEWKIGVNAMSIPSNIRVKALSLVFV